MAGEVSYNPRAAWDSAKIFAAHWNQVFSTRYLETCSGYIWLGDFS